MTPTWRYAHSVDLIFTWTNMFGRKKLLFILDALGLHSKSIVTLSEELLKLSDKHLISCSTCKCLIKKTDAVKGESRVESNIPVTFDWCSRCEEKAIQLKEENRNETIVTPYYCLRCKPKKK